MGFFFSHVDSRPADETATSAYASLAYCMGPVSTRCVTVSIGQKYKTLRGFVFLSPQIYNDGAHEPSLNDGKRSFSSRSLTSPSLPHRKKNKHTHQNLWLIICLLFADQPPLVRSQLGCWRGMPHILTQEAIADAFWLMESFMAGNGVCVCVCAVLLCHHAEACWRGLDGE